MGILSYQDKAILKPLLCAFSSFILAGANWLNVSNYLFIGSQALAAFLAVMGIFSGVSILRSGKLDRSYKAAVFGAILLASMYLIYLITAIIGVLWLLKIISS